MTHEPPGPLVIKIGGAAIELHSKSLDLWQILLRTFTNVPGGVVLVHGGGNAVGTMLDALGMPTHKRDGVRITPPEQMGVIAAVLAGQVNKSLVGTINVAASQMPDSDLTSRVRAVGLCLGDGGAFTAKLTPFVGFDAGRVGEVITSARSPREGELVRTLLRHNFLPVISSVGIDSTGSFLNVNADNAAGGVARVLGARGLVLLTDVPGVLDGNKRVFGTLSPTDIHAAISAGSITGGMIPKVRSALAVAQSIRGPVTIMNSDPQLLAALLRGDAVGTAVTP